MRLIKIWVTNQLKEVKLAIESCHDHPTSHKFDVAHLQKKWKCERYAVGTCEFENMNVEINKNRKNMKIFRYEQWDRQEEWWCKWPLCRQRRHVGTGATRSKRPTPDQHWCHFWYSPSSRMIGTFFEGLWWLINLVDLHPAVVAAKQDEVLSNVNGPYGGKGRTTAFR